MPAQKSDKNAMMRNKAQDKTTEDSIFKKIAESFTMEKTKTGGKTSKVSRDRLGSEK